MKKIRSRIIENFGRYNAALEFVAEKKRQGWEVESIEKVGDLWRVIVTLSGREIKY